MDAAQASSADGSMAALRQELRDLYEDVAALLDDDRLEELPDHFIDECVYKVISKENFDEKLPHATVFCDGIGMLRDRIMALRETQVYEPRALRHFISGVRVTSVADGTIHVEANFMITESMTDAEPTLLMVGRYVDQLVRQDGRLLFKERQAVFDNYRVYRSIVAPV